MYAVSRSAIVIVQSSPPPCVPISAVWSREISGFRYWFPRLVSVMSLHDTYPWERGRGSRKPRVPQISRSLHANRLRRVAPSPPFPSYILHLLFETSSRRRPPPPSFPPHSIFVDASRCLAEILRFPPRYFREAVRKNGGGEEGRRGLLLWRHGCSAGYFLSCGKRRMRRTRTNRRIVLWPSADLSSSTTSTLPFLGPPPPTIVSGTRSTRFYASLFNSDCVFCPIRPRQPD